MKKLFYAILASAVLFFACDEIEIPATLDIPEESLEYFNHGINFSATSEEGTLTVKVSFTSSLNWSAAIEDAEGKPVSWFTVSPTSGLPGDTEITVTALDNKSEEPRSAKITVTCGTISKSINVTQAGLKPAVIVHATEIKIDQSYLEMEIGQTEQLHATVLPENATDKSVMWISTNSSVATVTDGLVSAVSLGEALITAATADGVKAECVVKVKDHTVPVSGLSLNKTSVKMYSGQSLKLTATVTPDNATDKTVTWQSSDTAVATVDDQGLVQTIGGGKAKITAIAGDAKAECEFEVVAQTYATPVALDLGLSVKWASFDLGATAPEQMGYFFAWGETEPGFTEFDRNHYDFIIDGMLTKYCSHASAGTVDNKTQLELEDDAAHVKLGNGWRLPTKEECDELGKCDAYADVRNGVKGFVVVGKNGNTVFFPYNTHVYESLVYDVGKSYSSWTSTRNSSSGLADALQIRFLDDNSDKVNLGANMYTYRFSGYCIRPVKD